MNPSNPPHPATTNSVASLTPEAAGDRTLKFPVFIFSSYPTINPFILFASWAHQSMHYLPEILLGLIGENATWKLASGFNKVKVKSLKDRDKNLVDHYHPDGI